MSKIPVLCGLAVSFGLVSTVYLDLVEYVGPIVIFAVIGVVNVKFSLRFCQCVFIGGFLGTAVVGVDFADGRLQFKDGVCAIFPSQGGLEMLIRAQSGRQCDCFDS